MTAVTPSRVTWQLAVILLASLAVNLLLWQLSPPGYNDTGLDQTIDMLMARSGDDSWGPMALALEYLDSPGPKPLYAALFFEGGIKFQYPPSALFTLLLMFLAAPERVRISDDMKAVRDARRQKVAVPQGDGSSYVFDQDKQEWVKLRAGETPPPGAAPQGARTGRDATPGVPPPKKLAGPPTRVIEVSYDDLVAGVPGLNVVVRNGDTIYCDAGERGVVYIDGEVQRPGVYQLPEGGRLTLSRLVSAAGGLGQIAIPERCDLIRRIGDDREATVRVNLAAIRNRGEPDIYMKPDDHVIVGTNFWATPLAVTRNGFRMTYGFGFLLDRNFGNDVFGPPPVNVVGE